MTMLGRGKRSASDKKKPDAKSDAKTDAAKSDKADKAARAAKAAKAAELAEEAAERAREAARLAQIAADEAAATDAEDADEPAKSPEKPRGARKPSRVEPDPEIAAEGDSAASEDDSTTPGPPEVEADEAVEAAGEAEEVEAEEVETEEAEAEEADESDDEDEPAKPKRLKLKKAARAEESDDEDDDEDDGEPRRARLGFPTVIAVLAVLTIALGAGTTVLGLKVKEQRATQQAAKEATFASSHAAQKMSSYDYRTLDTDLKAASALTTGKLHTQYGKLADQLKTVAVQQQAVSNTTVMKVGVVSATPDKVVTLVYANRSSATKSDKEQRLPEPLRIKMTMVEKDGRWLASEVTVLS
ncbi:membrane protein [Mycobacterium tuberculosis]|nr:membrane protein [Mycobacterium tuberculosis]